MPNAYDVGLRRRAVLAYERGEGSYAAVAAVFDLNPRTLERWVARWRVAQSFEPRPRGGGRRSPIDLAIMRVLAHEVPDATVAEMCGEYNRRAPRSQRTTPSSLHRALVRDGFVIKKNGRVQVKLTGRTWWPVARRS